MLRAHKAFKRHTSINRVKGIRRRCILREGLPVIRAKVSVVDPFGRVQLILAIRANPFAKPGVNGHVKRIGDRAVKNPLKNLMFNLALICICK
jgi:hypothetical protein